MHFDYFSNIDNNEETVIDEIVQELHTSHVGEHSKLEYCGDFFTESCDRLMIFEEKTEDSAANLHIWFIYKTSSSETRSAVSLVIPFRDEFRTPEVARIKATTQMKGEVLGLTTFLLNRKKAPDDLEGIPF